MPGRRGFRSYPRHLKRKGVGLIQCQASGFLRHADDHLVKDIRQGLVIREYADTTPGFGTRHPQDVKQVGVTSDPSPIENAEPEDKQNLSKADLMISDAEIELSIKEGRPPRRGY